MYSVTPSRIEYIHFYYKEKNIKIEIDIKKTILAELCVFSYSYNLALKQLNIKVHLSFGHCIFSVIHILESKPLIP